MKRAQPDPVVAGFLEAHRFADDPRDVGDRLHMLRKIRRKRHARLGEPGAGTPPASSLHDVVEGQLGVFHDLVKNAFAQISFAVDRNGGSASVGMNENSMASRLTVQDETAPLQDSDDLTGIERGNLRRHTATRILCEPTSS